MNIFFFNNRCFWKNSLFQLNKSLGNTKAINIGGDDPWVRDWVIPGTYKNKNKNKKPEIMLMTNHNPYFVAPTETILDNKSPFRTDSQETLSRPNQSPRRLIKRNKFNDKSIDTNYRESKRALEGGQLFDVTNTETSERIIIMGEDVLMHEKYISEAKKLQLADRDEHYKEVSSIKRYAKIFNIPEDKIIIVPNLTYHIDLQMAYLGNNTFFIHSFEETFKKFPEQKRLHDHRLTTAKDLESKKIKETLEELDFNVIEGCGSLYLQDPENLYLPPGVRRHIENHAREGAHIKYDNKIWHGCYLKSIFINGQTLQDKDGNFHFITMDSYNEKHKNYFKEILEKHKITTHFLKTDDGEYGGYIVSKNAGGLRCQISIYEEHIPPIYKSYIRESMESMLTGKRSDEPRENIPNIMHPQNISPEI